MKVLFVANSLSKKPQRNATKSINETPQKTSIARNLYDDGLLQQLYEILVVKFKAAQVSDS
jgi:hypothetical protein